MSQQIQRSTIWAAYLIERFDLDIVRLGGASQETALFVDPDEDIGLHVGFNREGVHLQLGTAPWSDQMIGSVQSRRKVRGDSLGGHLGESLEGLQERRMERLRQVFDNGCDTIYDAWVVVFGRRSLVEDDRDFTEIPL